MSRAATPKPSIEDAIGDFRAIASGARRPAVAKAIAGRKAWPKGKLTDAEITKRSTPKERSAAKTYNSMRRMTWMDETDMLILGQAVSILIARNERLGLIPK